MYLLLVYERFAVLGSVEANAPLMARELQDSGEPADQANGAGPEPVGTEWLHSLADLLGPGKPTWTAALVDALAQMQPHVVYLLNLPYADAVELMERLLASPARHAATAAMN